MAKRYQKHHAKVGTPGTLTSRDYYEEKYASACAALEAADGEAQGEGYAALYSVLVAAGENWLAEHPRMRRKIVDWRRGDFGGDRELAALAIAVTAAGAEARERARAEAPEPDPDGIPF